MQAKPRPYTHPWPLGWVERSDIGIVQTSIFFIELLKALKLI